jgi:UDP-N-acetylglucosamine/UDP-N-acetylgalactosamine diphosphorylase
MTYDEAKQLLDAHGQGHVLQFWGQLDEAGQVALLAQIETLDFDALARMSQMLGEEDEGAGALEDMAPASVVGLEEMAVLDQHGALGSVGAEALSAGRVGCLLVAGGQGSRLGFDGPKGAYEVGPITDATLFQIHARKILALERKYDAQIPFYIMTSEVNDAPTRAFFECHDYFGLDASRVKFFTQGMWPALSPDGKIILDAPGHIFMSPDGHGGTLTALEARGMFSDMRARGVDTVFYFQVDNPLIEICDPRFIGLHLEREADISVKVCAKRDPDEGLGVVVHAGGCDCVVEYTELTMEQKHERTADGELYYRFGSVAIHLFSRDFMEREVAAGLPLHLAHKKVPCCDGAGTIVTPSAPNAYKFEKFIFDVLPDAESAVYVEFSREEEFSPVKNATGNDSPESCRRDMVRKYARWLDAAGYPVPRGEDGEPSIQLEIDPCFALGSDELVGVLDGVQLNSDLVLLDSEEEA